MYLYTYIQKQVRTFIFYNIKNSLYELFVQKKIIFVGFILLHVWNRRIYELHLHKRIMIRLSNMF